jgi:hypothetical protein
MIRYPVCCASASGATYWLFDQFSQWRRHMTNEALTVRIAQALLAVGVTTASILVFQIAMVVG